MGETLVIVFVFGVFLLFFGFFLVDSARDLRKANDSLRWPSTSGQILSPGTKTVSHWSGRHGDYGSSEQEVRVVRYSYTVDGAEYSGERISYGGGAYENAKNAVAKYRAGYTVKVYYNPSDPSEAVLEPGGRLGNFGCMVVVFIFLLVLLRAFIFDVILDR